MSEASKTVRASNKIAIARISYNYCGLCGRVPKGNNEPNYAPIKWWDADDGWKITTLCRHCVVDTVDDIPKEGDFAYEREGIIINTDEDIVGAL